MSGTWNVRLACAALGFLVASVVVSPVMAAQGCAGLQDGRRAGLYTDVKNRCFGTSVDRDYCVKTDESFAIVRDKFKSNRLLLVPREPVPGIESPDLLKPEAPNYWLEAWSNRMLLSTKLRLEHIGLAVNSAYCRTQGQLHIHIGCIRPTVLKAVRDAVSQPAVDAATDRLPNVKGFTARRLTERQLAETNVFRDAAKPNASMANQTLVLLPAADGGIYVLQSQYPDGIGAGENLLDVECAVLRELIR